MIHRRKSIDSSSSSESGSDKDYYRKKDKDKDKDKDKKDKKKDKKDKKEKKEKESKDKTAGEHDTGEQSWHTVHSFHSQAAQRQPHSGHSEPPLMPPMSAFEHAMPQSNEFHENRDAPVTAPPPSYGSTAPPPPSGYRVPLTTTAPFPGPDQTKQPPFYDADGVSPIFIGSALLGEPCKSVHPCKIGPHLSPFVSVPYGGAEYGHHGRYDLLPFDPSMMELVPTSHGQIPPGRRPLEGGYEEGGEKLYHAVANVNNVMVPGKTGQHLGGCNVSFGGAEYVITENYQILCWR